MLESNPWLSVLPPLVAIAIAIKFRQVYIALIIGIWSGSVILLDGHPLKGLADTIERMILVFKDEGNTKIILFSALIGALIAYIQRSGGVRGFIQYITSKNIVKNRTQAQLLTVGLGMAMPIESSMGVLVTGTISRPLFDKLKISREKLAYLCDSISAPICSLIPINAWGAYIATLLTNQGLENTYQMYLMSIPLNFYSILAILFVIFLALTGKDFFTMKTAEIRAREEGKVLKDGATPLISAEVTELEPIEGIEYRARNMVIPVLTMVFMMVAGMYITGDGDMTKGSGSTSVLWAVLSGTFAGAMLYRSTNIMNLNELISLFFKGVGGLIPIAILMVFAFAIGQLCKDLGTGAYVADISSGFLSPKLVPLILFVTTGFIAFSTGTSWGTWAIMFPIGIGIAQNIDIAFLPIIGAMVSGGVFGDHCSPISDSTLVSSMASASDHMDHVNTQLPYALICGTMAAILFLAAGMIMY